MDPFYFWYIQTDLKRLKMKATAKRIKLVPVTDNRNIVTVDGNLTIVEVNRAESFFFDNSKK